MGAYKDKGGRWYVSVRYKNWLGEPSRKTKRGFTTKRDALAWEREFLQKSAGSLDMTFNSFCVMTFYPFFPAVFSPFCPALTL